MVSFVLTLLTSWTVVAQTSPVEFTTAFRGRPVRIVISDIDQLPFRAFSEADLAYAGLAHAQALIQDLKACEAQTGPRDLRVQVDQWSEMIALGPILALAGDPRWIAHPKVLDLKGLFKGSSEEVARRAVEPFRKNWLYSSADAAALNEIERWLALAYARSKAMERREIEPVRAKRQTCQDALKYPSR